MDLAARRLEPRRVTWLPSATITTPGRTASTLQPSVGYSSSGHLDEPHAELPEQLPQPDRQERQEDDREVVGDRRDDRQQVDELGGAAPVRHVEDPDVAADDLRELARARVVRPQRPPDAEQVRPKPERVAALDRPRRLDPAGRRDPRGLRPRLEERGLARAVRLAGPQRDRPAVADERAGRTCRRGPDRWSRRRGRGRSTPSRSSVSTSVSCSRWAPVEVDRAEEAVGRVVEGPPEGRPRPLHEHLAQVGGHALGAVAPLGQRHRRRIRFGRRVPFGRRAA